MLLPPLKTSRVVTMMVVDCHSATVQRTTQRVPLPKYSLFEMVLETNSRWIHIVHTDKRPENTKIL